jgi:hypothetical protein
MFTVVSARLLLESKIFLINHYVCYSLHSTPRRTWNLSRSNSQNSGDDGVHENHLSNKKTKRIGEHARKIKKALLKQHNNLESTDNSGKIS